ncbi:MAG: response regulator [Nitrospirae bacterium]|nr:response regulator [Nitrospirota bacterium]
MAEYNFLVVEDSPTMRQLISFSLKRIRGAKIIEAGNGVEALKKLSENKFNLILADINMPLMDGLKLLSIVRKDPNYSHVPVIIVSTEGTETDKEKGMKLGANAYLPKPIQTSDLLRTVKTLLKIED